MDLSDPIAFTLPAIGAGATAGAAVAAAGPVAVRLTGTTGIDPQFTLLTATLLAGIAVGAFLAHHLMPRPIETWRRGVTAAIAGFGTVLLTGLTAPLDHLGGPIAVAAYGITMAALSVRWARAARAATR